MTLNDAKEALDRYTEHRIPTGSCLLAALKNDLIGFFARADLSTQANAAQIVKYIFNHLPAESWGSVEKVQKWLNNDYAKENN